MNWSDSLRAALQAITGRSPRSEPPRLDKASLPEGRGAGMTLGDAQRFISERRDRIEEILNTGQLAVQMFRLGIHDGQVVFVVLIPNSSNQPDSALVSALAAVVAPYEVRVERGVVEPLAA